MSPGGPPGVPASYALVALLLLFLFVRLAMWLEDRLGRMSDEAKGLALSVATWAAVAAAGACLLYLRATPGAL